MALRLTELDETNRPAFEALLVHAWRQNWAPDLARDLIRWRYYDRPLGGKTWLAHNSGQCVAMLDSFVRPYLLDGRRILVREGCDWYCLPKYRPLGLGIRLMRELMACPEPGLSVGGRDVTVSTLPRLGWTRLPDLQNYVLPVTARAVASVLLRERWPHREAYASAIPGFISLRRPRRASAPGGVGHVAEWWPGTSAALPVPQQQGLVQLLEPTERDWIARIPPGVAKPIGLVFSLKEAPIAFSLSQIEASKTGFEGRIVHLQIAEPAQEVVNWVVAETAMRLAARGAGIIRCSASSAEKDVALRRAGFIVSKPLPSYWWPKADLPSPSRTDAGYLHADNAVPFPALHARHLRRGMA